MSLFSNATPYRFTSSFFLVLTSILLPISNGFALSLPMPIDELTSGADLIVFGRVRTVETKYILLITGESKSLAAKQETEESIFTHYKIDLLETFKKKHGDTSIDIFSRGGFLPNGDFEINPSTIKLDTGDCFIGFLVFVEQKKMWMAYAGNRGVFKLDSCESQDSSTSVIRNYKDHFTSEYDPSNVNQEPSTLGELIQGIQKE